MTQSEKNFIHLLENNGGEYDSNDKELSETLGVGIYSIAKYKRRLKDLGYIDTKLKHVNGKLRCFYKLLKPYDERDEKHIQW